MWLAIMGLARDERAISSVEYAMLLALVGAGILVSVLGLGEQIATRLNTAATTIQSP